MLVDWSSKLVDLNVRDDELDIKKMKMVVQESFQPSSCPVTLKSRFMVPFTVLIKLSNN